MNFLSTYFSPAPSQLLGLAAVLVIGLAFTLIGAAITGKHRYAPADILVGWAFCIIVFTLIGTQTDIPFTPVTIAMGLFAIGCGIYVWKRDKRLLPAGAVKLLVLNILLFIIIAAMAPSQWDEFSHWLLAGSYLFEIDTFPRTGLEPPLSISTYYPNGATLIPYLASQISGHFVENASALFHILLLCSMALTALDIIRRGAKLDLIASPSWGGCALGFMTVTIFSTAFVQKVVFTAYADLPMAACVATAGFLGWLILQALSKNEKTKAFILAVQFGLVLLLLQNLKPTGIVLILGLCIGLSIAALRDSKVPFGSFLKLLPQMILPCIFIYVLWKAHIDTHFSVRNLSLLPFDLWQWHNMAETLPRIFGIMTRKGAYFGMMGMLSVLSFWALFRYRTPFDRFTILAGSTFVSYNAFLVFAYLAIFTGFTSTHALSYWRYNMHLAHLGVFCAAFGLAVLWQQRASLRMRSYLPLLSKIAIVIVLMLPLAFAKKLRFDVRSPKQFVHNIGEDLKTLLPKESRLFIMDPHSNGFYREQMRYQMYGTAFVTGDYQIPGPKDAREVTKSLKKANANYMWIHTQTSVVLEAIKLNLPEKNAHLLKKEGASWVLIKSWPYPGYNMPGDIKD